MQAFASVIDNFSPGDANPCRTIGIIQRDLRKYGGKLLWPFQGKPTKGNLWS